jgi:glycosyltransferase involved in cell wall biosynthesis
MIVPQALDLFHTQCTGCEESPLAARLAGVGKILGTFHVTGGYDLELRRSAWPHRTLETLSNHALDGAIAVSEFTRRDWIQRTHLPGKNVWTIHNGVDTEHFSPGLEPWADRAAARVELGLPPDALVVGGVGRLDRIKGFDCLIRAVARLAGVHLALAGSGPMQMQLTQLAAELGIAGRVHFLGFRPDVRRVYQTLDVMAVPSRVEALNYALLEAMAMQLPAVGACAGGIPEAIAEGQTGLLVDGHDPAAWAEALRQLLNSPDMRHRFGLAARARVCAGFAEQTMVRRTLDVYRSMLGQTRSFPSPLYAGERVRVRGSEREISLDSLNSAPIGPSPRPSPLHTGARGEAA